MPDSDPPDYRTPSPDAGHEAIRAPLAKAIDDLALAMAAGDDAYFLTDILFELLGGALATLDERSAQMADLTARVAALEPPFQEPAPEAPTPATETEEPLND